MDIAIEAVGRPQTMEAAFESAHYGGGLCVLAGNLAFGERISLDPYDLIKGRRIVGTWGGETDPDRDLPRYAELYLAGRFPFEQLITHTWPLAEINGAFEHLAAGKVSRGLIGLSGEEC